MHDLRHQDAPRGLLLRLRGLRLHQRLQLKASHIQRMQRWGRSSSGRPQHLVTRLQSIEPCSTEVTCGAIHALAAMGE
ncbi:hypothetical protein BN11_2020005 [Nostocoides australiense Ben110]|uniref:Uncharacterized protein n=1 Tax=Nostocoides australiense Ben110 TaxID=1193182 RepID=W6JVZ7_9MICO|nr:hypothetical protein BN11_2020005 [Tetrasphaera australiensis Ben110]